MPETVGQSFCIRYTNNIRIYHDCSDLGNKLFMMIRLPKSEKLGYCKRLFKNTQIYSEKTHQNNKK